MIAMTRIFLAVLFVSGLLGCAGKEFTRPEMATLKNGETTYAQVTKGSAGPLPKARWSGTTGR